MDLIRLVAANVLWRLRVWWRRRPEERVSPQWVARFRGHELVLARRRVTDEAAE